MKKNLANKLKITVFCLSTAVSGTAFSAELLYSLAAGQNENEALREDSSEVAVQLALSSPEQISAQNEVIFPLPGGELVTGTVIRTLEGSGPAELEQQADSVTVITITENRGALRMIAQDGYLTGMILVDNKEQKIYRAALDSTGSGILQEDDRNKYLCVDFPVHKDDFFSADSADSAEMPAAELTPDLSALQNLESRPGSSNTLYINYWGGSLSGTKWNDDYNNGNDIVYTPYSSDADTNSFSATDRYNMWLGWQEAAEDYAPFDINVTTSKAVYLTTPITQRVQIIATTTSAFYSNTAGGVSYSGVFDTFNDYYRTGWAWNFGASSLGMTISHEAGHQIGGLFHDGTFSKGDGSYYSGHGVWGPIMGAPFGKAYVQWDKGEYSGANNHEDDLNIIKGVLGSVNDDAGDSIVSAAALTLPVTGYEGLITPNGIFSDVDVYSFSASGSTHIEVKPLLGDEGEKRAANLAINVTLKSAAGMTVAGITSDDNFTLEPDTNTFVYDGSLSSGTYYLTIDAVSPDTNWFTGFGEYGNGGMYRMSVSSSTDTGTSPDLVVTSPSVSDNTLTPNQFFTVYATVENQGTGAAGLTSLLYYRSADATISTANFLIGNDTVLSLTAGATSTQDISVAAPSSEGTYWFGACVNAVTGESDTTNQCSNGVQVAVVAAKPDLIVLSPSVSDNTLTPGQSFTINATVKNQGTATSGIATLRYYRSTDSIITTGDNLLSTDSVGSLAAGTSSAQNASVAAPTSDDTYWIGACVDTVTNESNINNQCSSGVQITVGQGRSFPWLLFLPALL